MTIYLSSALNSVKNTYGFETEKRSYLNRLYENYTDFLRIKPTEHKIINEALKIALTASTVGVFVILSVGAFLLDTTKETIDLVSRSYRPLSNPTSRLELVKEFLKENKKYLILGISLTAITIAYIVNRTKIDIIPDPGESYPGESYPGESFIQPISVGLAKIFMTFIAGALMAVAKYKFDNYNIRES